MVTATMKLKLAPWKKSYDQARQHIKKQRHYFSNKGPSSQSYGFSGGLLWMWELDYKESWAVKNWCFWTVVFEKTLESPLDCQEMQPIHPKGNQSWVFIGRTDAEAETPVFWPSDAKSWFVGKDSDAGKDWRQEEKGTTKDEMAGWHHQLNGQFELALGVGDKTGRPGMLQSMRSQRFGHWAELKLDFETKSAYLCDCVDNFSFSVPPFPHKSWCNNCLTFNEKNITTC